MTETTQLDSTASAASLIKPCLEKIRQNTTGRKHAKLQSDLEGLLEKLDILLAGTSPPIPQPPSQPPPQSTTNKESAPSETVSVGFQANESGEFTLQLTPSKQKREEDELRDVGHMPSSPMQHRHSNRKSGALADGAAREMMLVLRDAIETRKPIVMDVALDCLQKLIAFKLVQGPVYTINHKREALTRSSTEQDDDISAPLQFAAQPPQAQAVELICSCDDTGDEAVELRLLKALLTAATSPTLPLHSQALLLAVRAAYNVFLTSRSQVTQATAKATLTQVLTIVFQRLEAGTLAVVIPPITVNDLLGLPPADSSSMTAFVQQFLADVAVVVDPFGSVAEGVQAGLDDAFVAESSNSNGNSSLRGLVDISVHGPSSVSIDVMDPSDPIDAQKIHWRPSAAAEQKSDAIDQIANGNTNDGNDVGGRTVDGFVSTPPTKLAAKETAADAGIIIDGDDAGDRLAAAMGPVRVNDDAQDLGGDGYESEATDLSGGADMAALSPYVNGIAAGTSTPYHNATSSSGLQETLEKDAFLVFRALCKLSIRNADQSTAAEVTTIRGKMLALELLKILLENSGPVFRSRKRFINAIKQYLCLSLLKNCSSSTPAVQHLSSSIFLTLYSHFRSSLKAEIGVFYPMILLRPIESPGINTSDSSTVEIAQRAVALRCLQGLCLDGQMLVDLFVNYDCDLGGANLFERTINASVRLAQGTGHAASQGSLPDNTEGNAVRYEALRFLVSALTALRVWYDTSTATVDARLASHTTSSLGDGIDDASMPGVSMSLPSKSSSAAMEAKTMATTMVPSSENESMNTTNMVPDGAPPPPPPSSSAAASSIADNQQPSISVEDSLRSTWMERLASGQGGAPAPMAGRNQAELLQSWKAFKRIFEEGIVAFNRKPKKGIAFLQSQKLVGEKPEDVSRFLATTRGLNRTAIGDYLGEREDFNLQVMHAYVDALDFTNLEFDASIRKFLAGFRLPGEAQKIDRLMEKFAERFVRCNADSFKSADVAYVLAYSVIMLNTDAHNPMVKNKMTKADFLRNNRGINDGGDLPVDFMESLYDRIQNNEIKMKDEPMDGSDSAAGSSSSASAAASSAAAAAAAASSAGWIETFMALLPGRQRATTAEPTEEAIRRTAEYLRGQAKGAMFYTTKDGDAVQPMVDVMWAPLLGAFSVLFEEQDDGHFIAQCLEGFVEVIALTCRLRMGMLRSTFISSLAGFTMLHAPPRMKIKHAQAFRALLRVAESNGNAFGDDWLVILRTFSRFELLLSLSAGVPTDASLFSSQPKSKETSSHHPHAKGHTKHHDGLVESYSSIADMSLQATGRPSSTHPDPSLPSQNILLAVDAQELNRIFVDSVRFDSEAVIGFVRALSSVAQEELRSGNPPRVYSLTKIVETAHFNMKRIRLVWGKIWAVLSDFFITVGCHESLAVSMYAVDSLRQLSMKFLERDEMANYNFQNDFLRPFVVLVRRSTSAEIRELVIRCVSQMVLARAANIKSGWKSVFMVFTTAASDESPHVVRLAFDTVEKIVREHFSLITETETTTFTDCVNCLVAFTNNPHSLDVSLNAIAFLRFCAGELAEGDIEVNVGREGLPEGAGAAIDPNTHRIRPVSLAGMMGVSGGGGSTKNGTNSVFLSPQSSAVLLPTPLSSSSPEALWRPSGAIRFTDRDEHMYFWFPLLAGLSELTFDPRQEIRYGALGVLFDILKYHGGSFTSQFWIRVYDSVLLPMFDHVRAEVTDTTTFTDEARRAEADAWLYETCTATLQHLVDVIAKYYDAVPELLNKTLDLLSGFIRRSHQSLAGIGVAALTRLAITVGDTADDATWLVIAHVFQSATEDTIPNAADLIQQRLAHRSSTEQQETITEDDHSTMIATSPAWSFGHGAGSRHLAELRCHASIQLLLAQALGEVYAAHSRKLPTVTAIVFLDSLQKISEYAIAVDADVGLRHSLVLAQAADGVAAGACLPDPPFLRLEVDAAQCYLSVLMTITACGPESLQRDGNIEGRLVALCVRNLERFEQQSQSTAAAVAQIAEGSGDGHQGVNASDLAASLTNENELLAPVAVATLKAMLSFSQETFQNRVKDIFPLLSDLISCDVTPEVQRCLSEIFSKRIASLVL